MYLCTFFLENDFEALSKDDEHSYIRYQDLRNLKALASRTIMVIKAPSDTHLEVPRPDSPTRVSFLSVNYHMFLNVVSWVEVVNRCF